MRSFLFYKVQNPRFPFCGPTCFHSSFEALVYHSGMTNTRQVPLCLRGGLNRLTRVLVASIPLAWFARRQLLGPEQGAELAHGHRGREEGGPGEDERPAPVSVQYVGRAERDRREAFQRRNPLVMWPSENGINHTPTPRSYTPHSDHFLYTSGP